MERSLPGHSAVIAEVAVLVVVVGGGSGLDQDDVLLLEFVVDLIERLVYLGRRNSRSVFLMAEVQDNAVGETVLEWNLASARTVGSDMLYGVHVGAGVVALDDRVGGGQLVHAILIRPDTLREVLPGVEH